MNKARPNEMDEDFPPLSPSGERSAPDDPEFVRECLSTLDLIGKKGTIDPGPHLLTLNKKWGVVFRADLTIGQKRIEGLIDRLVCWRREDGRLGMFFAIGQDVPPLVT
jgi:hypothetical protein